MPGLQKQATLLLKQQSSLSRKSSKSSSISKKQSNGALLKKKQSSQKSLSIKISAQKTGSLKKKVSNGTLPSTSTKQGIKRKLSENVSKRGRKRLKPTRFQPISETPSKKKKKGKKPDILYRHGAVLAILNEEDGFWLACALENVREDADSFRAKWLEESKEEFKDSMRHFTYGYVDRILLQTVITEVHLKKGVKVVYLNKREEKRIMRKIEGEDSEDEEAEYEEEDDDGDTPKKSKKGKTTKAAKKAAVKKPKLTPEERRDPNRRLKPRASVKVPARNPFFYNDDQVPFISVTAYTKLVSRAVLKNDIKLLKKLISNRKQVSCVNLKPCVSLNDSPVRSAIKHRHKEALNLLLKELFTPGNQKSERCQLTKSLLSSQSTGNYNFRSLGVPAVRALNMSRGSREGNNALAKDLAGVEYANTYNYVEYALELGVEKSLIDNMMIASNQSNQKHIVHGLIWKAIRFGHRKLAGQLIKEQEAMGMTSFNFLHQEVLLFNDQELRKNIRIPSVKKKPWDNRGILPLHCAAINPNPKYLSKLLSILPEYTVTDQNQKKPIHYAAACSGSGPMELLIKRGQSPDEPDGSGMTCLHIACETGRVGIITYLLKRAQSGGDKDEHEDDDEDGGAQEDLLKKFGVGGIDRPVLKPQNREWFSYCPLHIAIQQGNMTCVQELIKFGADIKKELGAAQNRQTPLIIAASHGSLDIATLLISRGAPVEQKDKLKRTALIHACMNGQAHVAAYLLSLGANPNHADSSGNTCIHYATAYGWHHCVELLLKTGADPNTPNDWKVTPVGIAFLKGHMGIIDILLEQPTVDINFRDDKGMTLVAIACAALDDNIVEQIQYLVEKKKADCSIVDVNNASPLHHLANCNIKGIGAVDQIQKALDRCEDIAKILLENGCDPNAKNSDGMTALMYAVQQCNQPLVQLLVNTGCAVSDAVDSENKNVLHLLAEQCMNEDLHGILKLIAQSVDDEQLKKMSSQIDHSGFTPLHIACKVYHQWHGKRRDEGVFGVNPYEEEEEEEDMDDENEDNDDDYSNAENDDDEDNNSMSTDYNDNDDDDDDDVPQKRGGKPPRGQVLFPPAASLFQPLPQPSSAADQETPAAKQWRASRGFITSLVKICGADVNYPVQEKHFKAGEKVPEEEEKRYSITKFAKMAPIFFMIKVKAEIVGENNQPCPGLSALLKLNPDLTQLDFQQRSPLIVAVRDGHLEATQLLINAGADPNAPSANEEVDGLSSPVVLAAMNGCEDILVTLLLHKVSLNGIHSKSKKTVLHYAVSRSGGWSDSLKMISLLIDAGSDINALDKDKRTALHWCVNANGGGADATSEVEQLLIDRGADVHALDCRGRSPVFYAFVKIGKHTDTSVMDPIDLCSTLTSTMDDEFLARPDDFGQTALHRAAIRGAGVCCMHLLQHKVGIDVKDKNGNTALALAVDSKHESCTILLLQRNAHINNSIHIPPPEPSIVNEEEKEKNEKKKPKWLPSCLKNNKEPETVVTPIFQRVVELGWQGVAFIMLDMRVDFPYSHAVRAALVTGKLNLALTLIRKLKDKAELKVKCKNNQNLFHVLSRNTTKRQNALELRVASALLESGVKVNEIDEFGASPLHYACLKYNLDLAEFLISNGDLDVNLKDNHGRTPMAALFWGLMQKTILGMVPMVEFLQKKGASLNTRCAYNMSNMLFPAQDDDTYEEQSKSVVKVSPLIRAIHLLDIPYVKCLSGHLNADVNYPDSEGLSPLMHAVKTNNLAIVTALLDPKFDLDEFQNKKAEKNQKKVDKDSLKTGAEAAKSPFITMGRLAKKKSNVAEYLMDIDTENPEVTCKTSLDLNAIDDNGWTAVHHLVRPFQYGSFENVQILRMLHSAGADLDVKSGDGKTALDLALKCGASKMAYTLRDLMQNKDETEATLVPFRVSDGIQWTDGVPDYKADAAALLEKHLAAVAEEEKREVVKYTPDKRLNIADAAEVVWDEESGKHFDILLSKIDVKAGEWGLYNFYKMQLVCHKAKSMFVLFTCWGRIGDEGQYQQTPFPDDESAKKEFMKIFRAKTGNEWKDIDQFENKPKKYRLVDSDRRGPGKKIRNLKYDLTSKLPSKLPQELQHMMKEITDMTAMSKAIRDIGINEELMPFGRIKKENLEKALEILKQCLVLAKSIAKRREEMPIKDLDAYHAELTDLSNLTNEYYHLIPQKRCYAYEQITPLETEDAIGEQWKHISSLMELEVASKMLAGAHLKSQEKNPLDYVYRCIGTEIELLKETDTESEYLMSYINKSMDIASQCKVTGIFRVKRPGEDERLLESGIGNRRLLFHGSSTSNLISILTKGLMIAPVEAPTCGYMFGKGIYTADMFSKSAAYCYNWGVGEHGNHKFMLVCEVALGRVKPVYQAEYMEKAKDGYDSTQSVGSRGPDASFNLTLPTGPSVPLGTIIDQTRPSQMWGTFDNEFIVYNENQVALRYIIRFK